MQKYVSATCSPVKNAEGVTIGVVLVFRDITRLRTLEIKHQREKEYSVNLINQLPALVWRTDKGMNCTYVNKNWIEFTGSTLEDSSGRGWLKVIYPEDLDKWEKVHEEAAKAKEPYSFETHILRNDGEYRWCLNTVRPYINLNGEFAGYIGTLYDITESKQAAQKVLENQMKYRSLFMNMQNGYAYCKVLYDENMNPMDLIFTEVNEALEKMLGITNNGVVGKRYGECDMVVDGLEALDAFLLSVKEENPYDLICLDIMMPKVDGVKVLKAIWDLETQKKIPAEKRSRVIMTTALAETQFVQDAFEIGCDAYAAKPIDTVKLTDVLSKLGFSKKSVPE